MKDEEMAEEYADNISGLELTCSLLSAKDKNHAYRLGRYDGFLAGLKAGRPQWHDLRKDKNDLPKDERWVGNQNGYPCYFDKTKKQWFTAEIKYTYVYAWCEIPTFDKE